MFGQFSVDGILAGLTFVKCLSWFLVAAGAFTLFLAWSVYKAAPTVTVTPGIPPDEEYRQWKRKQSDRKIDKWTLMWGAAGVFLLLGGWGMLQLS